MNCFVNLFFPPPQLPIHKSVVVSLRNSDDSDSDADTCSSSQMAFGGLEFMIKEARRTAEVGPVHRRCCRQKAMDIIYRIYSVTKNRTLCWSHPFL